MTEPPVLVFGKNSHRHLPWLVLVLGISAVVMGWYWKLRSGGAAVPTGSSPLGLVLGIAAGLIILFEFSIWPRKKFRAIQTLCGIPLGSAQTWLRAHIWLGLLSCPLAICHTGFHWGGHFNQTFLAVFLLVILSGVLGLTLQNFLPRYLLRHLPAETIHSAIPEVSRRIAEDADQLVRTACGDRYRSLAATEPVPQTDADDGIVVVGLTREHGRLRGRAVATLESVEPIADAGALLALYRETIRPYLLHGRRACRQLAKPTDADAFFKRLQLEVGNAEQVASELATWCNQRRQFDQQLQLHWWLHGWLVLHVGLSTALLMMLVVHVVYALRYW